MDDVDLDTLASVLGFALKSEQKEAVGSLLKGTDVFGVLPTGLPRPEARALHTRGLRL